MRYRFVHFLYYGALYNAIQPARKASWSGVTAAALVHFYEGHVSEIASQVGFLFEVCAGPSPGRASTFPLAAEHAFRVFAFGEAELLARRGSADARNCTQGHLSRREQAGSRAWPAGDAGQFSACRQRVSALRKCTRSSARARQLCVGDSPRLFAPLWGLQTLLRIAAGIRPLQTTSPSNSCGWRRILRTLRCGESPTLAPVFLNTFREIWDAAKTHFEQFRELDDPVDRADSGARRFGLEPGIMLRSSRRVLSSGWDTPNSPRRKPTKPWRWRATWPTLPHWRLSCDGRNNRAVAWETSTGSKHLRRNSLLSARNTRCRSG